LDLTELLGTPVGFAAAGSFVIKYGGNQVASLVQAQVVST